jgi:cobalt-zinc-cadmium efflux system protein
MTVAGVRSVHDLHVWALTTGKPTLTAHVLHDADIDQDALLNPLKQVLEREFGIFHATLQLETRACRQGVEGENYSAPEPPGEARGRHA